MAENSAISWTENTFNPWIGCTKVSAGCAHCYAERDHGEGSRYNRVKWGPNGTRSLTGPDNWKKPHKWNREAEQSNQRIKVFCSSLADVFEDTPIQLQLWDKRTMWICPGCHAWIDGAIAEVQKTGPHCSGCDLISHPLTVNDARRRLFLLIDQTPNLDWLLVTKRPENILRMWCSHINTDGAPPSRLHRKNVWLLTSVENQEAADTRIPELLNCRDLAPVLGLSCEPLLGPVDLGHIPQINRQAPAFTDSLTGTTIWPDCDIDEGPRLDWVIAGGESGPDARPMHPDWPRSLRDQCQAAGVPFHFKQWGEWGAVHQPIGGFADNAINGLIDCDYGEWHEDGVFVPGCLCGAGSGTVCKVGKKRAGRILDGREWDEFPAVAQP